MYLRAFFISAAIALTSVTGTLAAKEWKSVTITTEAAYAPWNLTNADGSLGGFEPELMKIVCARAQLDCKFVTSDWDGMIAALNAGKFDVIMDALSITDERKQTIDFTVPYASTPASFATMSDSDLMKAPGTDSLIKMTPGETGVKEVEALKAAFKGKTIGIQAATVYAKFVYDNFGSIATIREYKTGGERDLDLQNGRIDLGFDDTAYFKTAFDAAKGALAFTGPESAVRSGVKARGWGFAKAIPISAINSTRRSNQSSRTAP